MTCKLVVYGILYRSDSVSFVIDVGGVLGSIDGNGKKIIDRLLLIILKLLTSSQQTQGSYYWK